MSSRLTDAELVALIAASGSLDELRASLDERGVHIRGRGLRRRLTRAWKSRPAASVDDGAGESLPATVVVRDGIAYHIHGVLHGQRRAVRVGADVREAIRSSILAWDEPPSTGVCLERGMAKVFDVPGHLDLRYTDVFVRKAGARSVLRSAVRLTVTLPLLPLYPVFMLASRDPLTRELRHAMKSFPRFRAFRMRYLASELPACIRIDLDRHHPSGRNRVLHSECQVEAAVQRAEQLGVRVMHVVVGLGHENDLAYLLPRV